MPCHVNAACRCVRKRMRNPASIANHKQPLVIRFKVIVNFNLHIIKLDFHAVKERVVICRSGRDLIKRVNHFYYAV